MAPLRIDKLIIYTGLISALLCPAVYAMEQAEKRKAGGGARQAALPDSNTVVTDSQGSGGTLAGQTTGRNL